MMDNVFIIMQGNLSSSPVYHSIHDNFFFEANLTDPAFASHTAVGLVWGKVALMLVTSPVVPFDPRDYYAALADIFSGLEKQYGTDLSQHNLTLSEYTVSVHTYVYDGHVVKTKGSMLSNVLIHPT